MKADQQTAGGNYILPRDEKELVRLNEQHKYLLKLVYEDRLIYDERVTLAPGCSILDSGTGTGAWITDLARSSLLPPSAHLYATDVSSNNFPSSPPSNLQFTLASTTSLPPEWTSQFDLINQRFLMSALLQSEWPDAIAELYRVCKPGGAVQLVEMDLFYPIPKGPAMQKLFDITKSAYDANGLYHAVASHLDDLLATAGFIDVTLEKKYTPLGKMWGPVGAQGTFVWKNAYGNLEDTFRKAGLIGEDSEEFRKLLDDTEAEWDQHGVQFACRIATARKPLTENGKRSEL